MTTDVDVLVVGGGQAGLAASRRLSSAGRTHLVVDASARVGDSWRQRYDSLTLFTPRSLSSLPDQAMSGDPQGYASRDEFADYLESYADAFHLPVLSGTRVDNLSGSDGRLVASLSDGSEMTARSVIVCTGAFQDAMVPKLAGDFSSAVVQLTAASYRNPLSVPTGTVLVVGDGASGRDIAVDLSGSHEVLLATGKPRRLFPERVLGQSTWAWMDRLGLLATGPDTFMGRMMKAADPFPDRGRGLKALGKLGITVKPRLQQADGRSAIFQDGSRELVEVVVWAVGYTTHDSWNVVPAGTAGLHFLGRPWQRSRASGLILGAARESYDVVRVAVRSC
jgi:putative flavoprotein involved in K+ transport